MVCYAFSISPTAFVKQVNRATAETSQDSADAEGLAPLMRWVKDCIDRLLSEDFAAPDLEFAWVAEAAQDPLEQAQIDQIYVSAGIKTINEVRANLGLAAVPGGDAPVVELPGISPLPGEGSSVASDDVQRLDKMNFNVAAEPRVPKGNPDGGKWVSDGTYTPVAQKPGTNNGTGEQPILVSTGSKNQGQRLLDPTVEKKYRFIQAHLADAQKNR